MDTSGDKSYREDALNDAMEVFDEKTRSKAVVKACEHARRDRQGKLEAVRYLARHVDPEVLAEVVDRLATPQVPIDVGIEVMSGVENAHVDVRVGEDTE